MIKFDKKAMQKFNQIPDDIKSKILFLLPGKLLLKSWRKQLRLKRL